jgi:fatty acid amide hydrolase
LAGALPAFGYADAAHYWDLVAAQMEYQDRFRAALDAAAGGPLDVILCPACALPALTHGSSRDLTNIGGYTALYNVLGYPTGIVPLTRVRPDEATGRAPTRDRVAAAARQVEQGSAGLPVGVQVVARPWQDHVALAAMQALETTAAARPDFPTTPLPSR